VLAGRGYVPKVGGGGEEEFQSTELGSDGKAMVTFSYKAVKEGQVRNSDCHN
jgi:hypothetical protein